MKSPPPIRVLCVDDHPIVREGLCAIIGAQSDMELVAEAADGRMALEKYREHRPDVVVMDLKMPEVGGVEAITAIRKEFPAARIMVLTTYEGDEDIHRALEAGAPGLPAQGHGPQGSSPDHSRCLRRASAHPCSVAARLAEHTPRIALSARELQVLQQTAQGLRNKEIGAKLNISEETVKIHLKNIFTKLQVADRTQAVVVAARRDIIDLPHPP